MRDRRAPLSKIKIVAIKQLATNAALAATSQAWIATLPLTASSRGVKIVRSARLATAGTVSQLGSQQGAHSRVSEGSREGSLEGSPPTRKAGLNRVQNPVLLSGQSP